MSEEFGCVCVFGGVGGGGGGGGRMVRGVCLCAYSVNKIRCSFWTLYSSMCMYV